MLHAELVVDPRPNECCKSPLLPRVGISSCKSDCSVNLTSVLEDCPYVKSFCISGCRQMGSSSSDRLKEVRREKGRQKSKQAREVQFDVIAKRRQSRLLFSGKNIRKMPRSGDLNV